MVIELRQIVLAIPSLGKLSSLDLSLKTAYRLKQIFASLQKEADFFSEQRRKILDKYGIANEDGSYRFEGDNESLAQGELE